MRALLAAALMLGGATVAAASAPVADNPLHQKLFAAGVQRFVFDGWAGPAFPVWTYRSADTPKDAPILFVLHGVRRDADRYVGEWIELAQHHRIVLIVPEFDNQSFPGAAAYSHGWFAEKDGSARAVERRTFAAIEPLFAAVRAREGLTADRYALYGHSGGAQFVHRYALAGGGAHLGRIVAANAGSYAMADPAQRWPFGVDGLPAGVWDPRRAFAVPMTILLGTADNDPAHPNLPVQPLARAQGPHRLARGQYFYEQGRAQAARDGVDFAWSCTLVPGVGHQNGGMAPTAIAILFGGAAPPPAADCAALKDEGKAARRP